MNRLYPENGGKQPMPAQIPQIQKLASAAQLPAPTARAVVRVPLAFLPEYLRVHNLQMTGVKNNMLVTRPVSVATQTQTAL